MTGLPQLEDLPVERGTRVLVRCDFNVPVDGDGRIVDDLRIRAALPTIEWLRERRAKIICCSHFGRPKGGPDPKYSLSPVAVRLRDLLGAGVRLAPDVVGDAVTAMVESLAPGQVVVLENVRFHPGETKGDEELGAALAALADCYVNDAFGACHRSHASVVGPPRHLPSAAGRLVATEVEALGKLLHSPESPFVAVLGGSKVSDKIGVIDSLLTRCDRLLVGGAMASTFLLAQGHSVGDSLVEADQVEPSKARLESGKLAIPTDVVVAQEMSPTAETKVVEVDAIPDGWKVFDIGPVTSRAYAREIMAAATVFWNGPMGVFEMAPFAEGTDWVAEALADCPGYTVVGGGDSAAAMATTGMQSAISHISTGGGASLEYLEQGDLPGLQAIREGKR